MHLWFFCVFLSLLGTCKEQSLNPTEFLQTEIITEHKEILVGAERMDQYISSLKGKTIALVVNQTSMVRNTHLVDTLLASGIKIKVVFAPEHGFRGTADAGEKVDDSRDYKTGLPVVSLYGSKKKPTKVDIEGVDILIFDIQDVGVRFYTYLSTLHYIMESAAENDIPLMILDRPNPNAHYVDGPLLEEKYKSFVGMHPVPVVYGMTIGEYGKMINGEKWLKDGLQCKLTVMECANYTHETIYELPIKPSPNLPNLKSILLYPSICFFEGTTVSVGRGTNLQFQQIGHPSIKSNYSFTPQPFEGAKDPPNKGLKCYGLNLSLISTEELYALKKIDLQYVISYYKEITATGEKYFLENLFFDKLAGTDKLRKQIIDGLSEDLIRATWQSDLVKFESVRSKYLLYP
ncbi:MAG: DUF1343 domain-containing protein [Saprospiraceae bacterium]|nr:DUF1343 domain-containing protein [Saprospiraceae bacterium]